MKERLRPMAAVLAMLTLTALGAACGGGERGIQPTDTGGGDTLASDTSGADVSDVSQAPNACTGDGDCSGVKHCRSGVCVADPPAGVTSFVTDPHDNVPTSNPPDLSCSDQTDAAPVQTQTATLYGAVARFGDGRKTFEMHVDVLPEDGFDPTSCEGMTDATAQRACFRAAGTVIGSAVSVAPPTPDSLPATCTAHEDCPFGYQCTKTSSVVHECTLQFGLYEIVDVPLDTPLILRVWATTNEDKWRDTWVFNVILPADQVGTDGRVQYDATMVSVGQWELTPNTVGLAPIPATRGAIGGRVRDCRGASRSSWPISEVSIGLADPARGTVFFNNLEDDTVPLIDRVTTNILGRFAALDIAPGWNRIAGAARVGTEVVSVGSVPVYVFPNALSIVSWPGRLPYWRQH